MGLIPIPGAVLPPLGLPPLSLDPLDQHQESFGAFCTVMGYFSSYLYGATLFEKVTCCKVYFML